MSSSNRALRPLLARVGAVAAAVVLAVTGLPVSEAAHADSKCGSAIVDWIPDIGHPVAGGYEDLNVDSGAPRNMRIYYPSEHTPSYRAPLLQLCIGKYPVVLFLPGEVPPGLGPADYYKRWDRFGEVLARSGYVVVVPEYSGQLPATNYAPEVQAALADINYVQTAWSGADYVDTLASHTTIGGHSNGALLAARIAAAAPNFGAYFSLGGRFHLLPDPVQAANAGGVPSFFMWMNGKSRDALSEDLHIGKLWDDLPQYRYAVRYEGEHFDYLPQGQTGSAVVGKDQACVGGFAADLVAMFVANNIVGYSGPNDSLVPPKVKLTEKQKQFALGHLAGEFIYTFGCGGKADLEWWIFDEHGYRTN